MHLGLFLTVHHAVLRDVPSFIHAAVQAADDADSHRSVSTSPLLNPD